MTETQNIIRKTIKKKRLALSKDYLTQAETDLAKHFSEQTDLPSAKNIASYIPCHGEISPRKIQSALTGSDFHLPCITDFNQSRMQFYSAKNKLRKNRFGIYEPELSGQATPLSTMDIIFLPLIAFDRQGNRIGMGGGFYDRALTFKKQNQPPFLLGLAHYFQEVESLSPNPWDIPLDAILTDQEFIRIHN